MNAAPPPVTPARRGLKRYLTLVAAAAAACLFGVALAAWGVVSVQGWFRTPGLDFEHSKPALGEAAPDFALLDLNGEEYRLLNRPGRLPVVLEFGSATCPYCVTNATGMEDIARKYSKKAEFLFIYGREAHPNEPGMSAPGAMETLPALSETSTWAERAERARAYCSVKQPTARVLIDMDGPDGLAEGYGAGPNSVVVIDGAGRVVLKQILVQPRELDAFLEKLLSTP